MNALMNNPCDEFLRILHRINQAVDLLPERFRALDDALEDILAALSGLPGLGRAAIYLNDPETFTPILRAAIGRDAPLDAPDSRASHGGRIGDDPFALSEAALARIASAEGPVAASGQDGRPEVWAAPTPGEKRPSGCLVVDPFLSADAGLEQKEGALEFLGMAAAAVGRLVGLNLRVQAEREAMRREILSLRARVSKSFRQLTGVGSSRALERLRNEVERAALSEHPVVIIGGPGSGRAVTARVAHELSRRAARPFAATTFDGRDPEALAAELFGGVSADPAEAPSLGLLETSDGGAVLLRDPQTYPSALQKRLVLFLESGIFFRLGDEKKRQADVRIMVATSASSFPAAPSFTQTAGGPDEPGGLFFESLLGQARLERIHVPALRDREEDIPALVNECLGYLTRSQGRKPALTPAALKALESYDWPGNIRELEETLTRIVIAASDEKIDLADIPPEILAGRKAAGTIPGDAADLRDIERRQIEAALARHGWNQSRAARELGLSLRQIGYRIKKYNLNRE